MLAFEVEFLLGRYTAADFRDRDRAEWPSHPARLFSALVAAVYEAGLGESARAALLWLENLAAPHLHADPAPGRQNPVTAYVPVNDPNHDLLPQRAERQPRGFPSVVPGVPEVDRPPAMYFIWPEAQPDENLRQLLDAVAAHVGYLGSSRCPVRVRLADQAPPANWFPDEEGTSVLRVPTKGRLEGLEWNFQNGLRPSPGAFQRYRCGGLAARPPIQETIFGEMVVYRLGGDVCMEIETTLKLTDVLRAAAMRHAQDAVGLVPEVLSGHGGDGRPSATPHAAYVALPFASESQPHADGRVLGVAVVLPRDIDPEQRRQAMRALVRLDHLQVPGVGRLDLERVTPGQVVPYNLRPATWSGPASRWASVTPVLLDRFPKRNGRGTEAIVGRSCGHIGLAPPDEVGVDRFSPLHGVEPSFRYLTQRKAPAPPAGEAPAPPRGKARLYTHVTLTFARVVQGPVLLGAGRHFGLGLLRPLREERAP